jgi:hypothetical protein
VIYLASHSIRDMTLTAVLPKFVRGNHWSGKEKSLFDTKLRKNFMKARETAI